MTSPAEKYANSRAARDYPHLAAFRGHYAFELDDFQVEACKEVEAGHGVLVAAPTGSGKTIVGEFAVHLALETNRKCFYTTPIKALSNQKYADLVARHGAGGAKTRRAAGCTVVVIGSGPSRSPSPYATMPGDDSVTSRTRWRSNSGIVMWVPL